MHVFNISSRKCHFPSLIRLKSTGILIKGAFVMQWILRAIQCLRNKCLPGIGFGKMIVTSIGHSLGTIYLWALLPDQG
jgi:hypothetical protein